MNQAQIALYNEVLKIRPLPGALLDIGCGDTSFIQNLARALPLAQVTGLDIALPKRAVAPSVSFVAGDAAKLPFTSESFDVISSCMSMHHWGDKRAGLAEAHRALTLGGWLLIADPLKKGWLENRVLGWTVERLDGGRFIGHGELASTLNELGFEGVSVELIPKSLGSLSLIKARKP
ncbi:MAG: class I SAM-dependent methyltransferase [Coriobacteriia bacterium]|nr:class I SAM-dependent methyltransferase [Coriobacteriia bacterium]